MAMGLAIHEHACDVTPGKAVSGQGRTARSRGTNGPKARPPTIWPVDNPDDLEREYSPSSRAGGSAEPFIADYSARSAVARARLGPRVRDLGAGTLLVEAGPGAPLLVFIHGGYWQALSAADSLFLAPAALAHGWSYAAIEYTLAPAAALPTMVEECRTALAALAATAAPSATVLSGHSAGAHLAAMAALVQPSPLPLDLLLLVSGVSDLRPLVHTTVNDPLGMDEAAAAALSPMLLPVIDQRPQTLVTWGENDTDAFKRQGRTFAQRLSAPAIESHGHHHFDIVDEIVTLSVRTIAPQPPARG